MSYIMAISKEGINVGTATNPDDLNYSSEYNTLKYYKAGSVVLPYNGSNVEGTVAHNLGYAPFFTAYVNNLSPGNTWSMVPQTFKSGPFYLYMNAYANTANLYFRIETSAAVNTATFYYKIFLNNTGL